MPELNLDGQNLHVDDNEAQRIKNVAGSDKIKSLLDKFWTPQKLGKHQDLKNDHGSILMKDLKVSVEYFQEDLFNNRLKLGNFTSSVDSILTDTRLGEDLKSDYIKDCLAVTTERPAIGKGEFLFAASFNNIGFSTGSGDLVDLDTGAKIEVKGISASLGNGQNERFKPLSKSIMVSLYRSLGIDDLADFYLNADTAKRIKVQIGLDKDLARKTFTFLQNLKNENDGLARQAVELYFEKKQLIRTVAAMHMYAYMKIEGDQYLLLINDKKFSIFKSPKTLTEAYDLVDNLSLNSWRIGEYGVKVTLR